MKGIVTILWLALLASGCATSTVEKRKQERSSAYASLAPEMRALVDRSQIKVGMPMDAVYIAWGKPSQVITGESSDSKTTTTWIYHGTTWREHRYWNYRYAHSGYYTYPEPYLDYEYLPSSYIAAEVVFQDSVVKSWRNITQPQPY